MTENPDEMREKRKDEGCVVVCLKPVLDVEQRWEFIVL